MISFDEQVQREVTADEAAAAKVFQQYADAAASGNLDGLPRAKVLIGRLFTDACTSVQALQEALEPRDGSAAAPKFRRNTWAKWLVRVKADVLTVLLLRRALKAGLLADGFSHETMTFQRLAIALGRDVEREALLADATVVNPVYVDRAYSSLKKANTVAENHIQRTTDAIVTNVLQLESARQLEDNELMHIGKLLLQIALDIGLLTIQHGIGSRGKMVSYHLVPEVAEFLKVKDSDILKITDSSTLTMLAPPKPWTNLTDGGYYSKRRQMMCPLIALNRQQYKAGADKAYTQEKMPMVYSACNTLQGTAFTLSSDIVAVVARVWGNGGGVLGIPSITLGSPPAFPLPEPFDKASASEEELAVFHTWKRATAMHHTAVSKNKSKVLAVSRLIHRAKELDGKPVWCPVFMDWRGRIYYRGTPNPQGADFERAVLQFHDKKPLGKRGLFWLKVHLANSLGYDKVTFNERVAYVDQCWDALLRDSESPEDSDIFRNADAPMSALAAVLEIDKAFRSGNPETFQSGMVVHMDATCSGLQHFSAMLRDPVGGRYVNLINTGKREDIYQRLADILNERVRERSGEEGLPGVYASIWQELKVTRALAKKPVMTYVYSATINGVTQDVEDYLIDIGWYQPGVSLFGMANFMAKLMFKAIAEVVPAAAAAMKYLQGLAKAATKDGKLGWVTPTGFTVQQQYYKVEQTRVKIRSCGIVYAVCYKQTDNLHPGKMSNGIAPNFVHSLDASHLVKTVNACTAKGLSIVTIHDSFGTHAADVDTLLACTKEQFIDLYKDPNLIFNSCKSHMWMGRAEAESNNTSIYISNTLDTNNISIGTLILTDILDSPFFFS